jgi:hypothetical protein
VNSPDTTWRLRQQASQLTRLFIDAGLSGTGSLDTVARLGRRLEAHADLAEEADRLGTELTARSSQGFAELSRLQRELDVMERTLTAIHTDLGDAAAIDAAAAATSTALLDELQLIKDA